MTRWRTRLTRIAAVAKRVVRQRAPGRLSIYRTASTMSMPHTRNIMRHNILWICMVAVCACARPSHYGPRVARVSDKQMVSLRPGLSAAAIRNRIGAPSFIWSRRDFVPQKYPNTAACVAREPAAMWVYYDLRKGSACLYFDAVDRLLCFERNDIVIAQ